MTTNRISFYSITLGVEDSFSTTYSVFAVVSILAPRDENDAAANAAGFQDSLDLFDFTSWQWDFGETCDPRETLPDQDDDQE